MATGDHRGCHPDVGLHHHRGTRGADDDYPALPEPRDRGSRGLNELERGFFVWFGADFNRFWAGSWSTRGVFGLFLGLHLLRHHDLRLLPADLDRGIYAPGLRLEGQLHGGAALVLDTVHTRGHGRAAAESRGACLGRGCSMHFRHADEVPTPSAW